mmetsp:Transcript_40605/g.73387  ORF Transcript_40605/g.73387 Transcript_40605/m.73387 type:complete len:415 (+) Transcript_40605:733-1977(+)
MTRGADIPVTEWISPAGWSANLHSLKGGFEADRVLESGYTCARNEYQDQYSRRRSDPSRRRVTSHDYDPSPFIYRRWTYLGRHNKHCWQERDWCNGAIPSCGPYLHGQMIQDRHSSTGCLSSSCGDTPGQTYYAETYECQFSTYTSTPTAFSATASATTSATTRPPPRETFYTSQHLISNESAVGMLRMRFFMTDFSDPTGEMPGERSPSLQVIRIGQVKDGGIEKWTAPWPCSEEYSQDKMYYVTRDHYSSPRIQGLHCMGYYDNPYDAERLFMGCEHSWPALWRDWFEPTAYLAVLISYFSGCLLMSCTLPFLCASREDARPPCHLGRSCCLAVPLSLGLFLPLDRHLPLAYNWCQLHRIELSIRWSSMFCHGSQHPKKAEPLGGAKLAASSGRCCEHASASDQVTRGDVHT